MGLSLLSRAVLALSTVLFVGLSVALRAQTLTESCHMDGLQALVECGALSVPLDYAQPDGESISIGFVVLPGFSRGDDTPPLFFLAGGPGQAATSLAARVNQMLRDVRADRDIVLIDQRGTGRSAELICEPEEPYDLAADYDLIDPEVLGECVANLPAGIEHFTTANAIRDFERVRQYLGYPLVDLYGGSYGSRAAFAYLALAGGSVRAVVLDGVSPPSVPIGLFGASAASSFERAIERCYSVTDCRAAFPDLRAQFARVDAQLREGPVETMVPHPVTGETTAFRLWHAQFVSLLRLTLYSPDSTALLPAVIDAAAKGNYRPLAAFSTLAVNDVAINTMLNLTIVCNEDLPRFSDAAVAADADNSFGRDTSYRLWQTACPLMPRFDVDLAWMDAGDFPQPTLLLSGAADPVTPPGNGELAAGLFRRARHVVVPEAAHIVAGSDCGGQMIAEFVASPDPGSLDTSCLDDMPALRFRLDALGSLSAAAEASAP